jgi:ubiquinone biosynthesis protein UbiJ
VIFPISIFLQLRYSKQVIELIRSGDLKIDGDLKILQSFLMLVNLAEPDLLDDLSSWIGDFTTQGIYEAFKILRSKTKKSLVLF